MLLRLDPRSGQPIFEQIAFGVKNAVARGELNPGDRLPSVRELAKELAINPNTVARAYDALEAGGVIVRRQGSGCFVAERTASLVEAERVRRLDELLERALTEAFHLGFEPAEVLARVEAHLEQRGAAVRAPEDDKS
jgi:GntR family transcriptional regulator